MSHNDDVDMGYSKKYAEVQGTGYAVALVVAWFRKVRDGQSLIGIWKRQMNFSSSFLLDLIPLAI